MLGRLPWGVYRRLRIVATPMLASTDPVSRPFDRDWAEDHAPMMQIALGSALPATDVPISTAVLCWPPKSDGLLGGGAPSGSTGRPRLI